MTSKHFAVVGDPIDHSLSPNIHNAAYKFLGLDWDYTRFQVSEGNLQDFLRKEGSHLSGISVTMPLKLEAAALASIPKFQVDNTIGLFILVGMVFFVSAFTPVKANPAPAIAAVFIKSLLVFISPLLFHQ